MSWHTAAYTLLLGTTANTDVPALSDDVLTINNNHFILRRSYQLMAVWAAAPTLSRVRFDSPTMRFFGNPYIRPINVAALPPTNPNMLQIYTKPIILPQAEEIAIQATSAIAMGTERFTAVLFLGANIEAPPAGNVYWVRATSTTAAVANAWTTVAYTLETGLPSGQYAMIHSEVQSTNAQAHRWIFDEQIERPGMLSVTALGNRQSDDFYQLRYGTMGRFYNTSLPRLQVLANAADNAHEIYMGLIPLGRSV